MAKGSGGGKNAGKATPMTGRAASRVQSAAARNPGSSTASSGFASRAQAVGARNTGGGRGGAKGGGKKLLPVSLVRPRLCAAAPAAFALTGALPAGQRMSIRQRHLTLRARDCVPCACKECTMTHAGPAWPGCPRLVSPPLARDGCRACCQAVRPGRIAWRRGFRGCRV
jgi:hypothetical protein